MNRASVRRSPALLALLAVGVVRCAADAEAQIAGFGGPTGLQETQDEGTAVDSIRAINCVGAGITCARDGTYADRLNMTVSIAGGLPISDSTSIVEDNGDGTKEMRFEVSAITAGQTRVITVPDANVNLGALTTSNITDGTITTDDIAADTIAAADLAANSVGTSEVAFDYVQSITAGAGLASTGATSGEGIAHTLSVASTEAGFLTDGDASSLACGASTAGQMQVMDDGSLEWCDGNGTPALRQAAFGDGTGLALAGDTATSFFSTGTIEDARLSANVSLLGATIGVAELASADFGDFTCNGSACTIDSPGAAKFSYGGASTNPSITANAFCTVNGGLSCATTETDATKLSVIPHNCTLTAMYVRQSPAPGASGSYTFQLRDDSVDVTGATCQISGTGSPPNCSVTGLSQNIAAGSVVNVSLTEGGTAATLNTLDISLACTSY